VNVTAAIASEENLLIVCSLSCLVPCAESPVGPSDPTSVVFRPPAGAREVRDPLDARHRTPSTACFWLSLSASAVTFLGFSFTCFGPRLAGGYLLLPLQAELISGRRVRIHRLLGFGTGAGVAGILLPDLIVVAAVLWELSRGEGIHPVYRSGLPLFVLAEGGMILVTPTAAGEGVSEALARIGAMMGFLY
jgi:hypothetical protein